MPLTTELSNPIERQQRNEKNAREVAQYRFMDRGTAINEGLECSVSLEKQKHVKKISVSRFQEWSRIVVDFLNTVKPETFT
jgi:hypothetical protein